MISNQLPNCSPSRIILEGWTIWTRQSSSRSLRGSTKVKYPECFPLLCNFWHCWHSIKLLVKWLEIHESIRSMILCVFESTAAVHPEMQNPFSRAIYGVDVMLDSRFKPKILEVRLKSFPVWQLVPWISLWDVGKPALSLSSWTPTITIVISACSTQELEKAFCFTILCPAQYENTYMQVTYCPDCGRACKYDTQALVGSKNTIRGSDFFNTVFGCLFLDEQTNVSPL